MIVASAAAPPLTLRRLHPLPAASAPSRLLETLRASKVPEVTLGFWIIKILATTLGETGGDALSMGMGLGYLPSTGLFALLFLVLVAFQVRSRQFHPFLYWATVVGTTLTGTTLADFADRTLGLGYPGGVALLATLLALSLLTWRLTLGSVAVDHVRAPRQELFYWVTILFSNTLGTALGDWTSEGTGFGGGVFLFCGLLALLAALYVFTAVNRTLLFWAAFVLTRPLGASLGDLLTKPHSAGGLALSQATSSAVLFALMIAAILTFPQRPATPGASRL